MSRPRLIALTLACMLPLPLCGFLVAGKKTGPDQSQSALQDLEKKWLAVEDDPDALEAILADDFVHVLPVGFVTKREQLAFMRRHPAPNHDSKHFEDLRVRVFGTAGVVNGIVVATSADGAVRKTIFTDLFAYRNGKWQAVNAQELPMASGASGH